MKYAITQPRTPGPLKFMLGMDGQPITWESRADAVEFLQTLGMKRGAQEDAGISIVEYPETEPSRKHTPGPWTTSRDAVPDGYTQITIYSEPTGDRVATVFETPANARLIAAAPDLLEALKQVTEQLHTYLDGDPANDEDCMEAESAYQFAFATIQEAEGTPA